MENHLATQIVFSRFGCDYVWCSGSMRVWLWENRIGLVWSLLINKRSRKQTPPVERCPTSNTPTQESTERTHALAASAPTKRVSSESTNSWSAGDASESRPTRLASRSWDEHNVTYTQKWQHDATTLIRARLSKVLDRRRPTRALYSQRECGMVALVSLCVSHRRQGLGELCLRLALIGYGSPSSRARGHVLAAHFLSQLVRRGTKEGRPEVCRLKPLATAIDWDLPSRPRLLTLEVCGWHAPSLLIELTKTPIFFPSFHFWRAWSSAFYSLGLGQYSAN